MRIAPFVSRLIAPCAALGLGLAALAWPSTAHANGRFPESNAIFFSSTDADVVLLRTTFG